MLPRVLAVVVKSSHEVLRAGDHVIEPGSDQTEDDRQDQSVPDVVWVLASPLGLEGTHETADEDAGHRYDAVPADG